jgi:hypothetical protein
MNILDEYMKNIYLLKEIEQAIDQLEDSYLSQVIQLLRENKQRLLNECNKFRTLTKDVKI